MGNTKLTAGRRAVMMGPQVERTMDRTLIKDALTNVAVDTPITVAGWVRNERDGSVRCVVEGEPHQLDGFVKAVEGAMAGYITHTSISREDAEGDLSGFDIWY